MMTKATCLSLLFALLLTACRVTAPSAADIAPHADAAAQSADTARQQLFAELTPVTLRNCRLKRYGEPHDGGYLMCENLMGAATASYSYGIDGRDDWGCDVSRQLRTA